MNDNRTISLAIPTYMREDMLFESFAQVYDDPRINDITIVDDASDLDVFEQIRERCSKLSKVKLLRNANNRDCYFCKYTAVSFASNDYCILLDSDNVIDTSYIDTIFSHEWRPGLILTPEFAKPSFDFRAYSGVDIEPEKYCKADVFYQSDLRDYNSTLYIFQKHKKIDEIYNLACLMGSMGYIGNAKHSYDIMIGSNQIVINIISL